MGKCRSHGAPRWTDESYFYSQVSTGQHSACPSGKTANKDPNVESKGYRDDFDMRGKSCHTQESTSTSTCISSTPIKVIDFLSLRIICLDAMLLIDSTHVLSNNCVVKYNEI
jgi:hypothetical protein